MTRDHRFMLINKNFMNYPLARDRRLTVDWVKGKKTGRWLCRTSRDELFQFSLPPDVDGHRMRLPTGFDMNVLYLILSEAQIADGTRIEFPSRAGILHALGMGADTTNRKRLNEALELWSVLTVTFDNWYFAKRYLDTSDRKNGKKVLPPPIRSFAITRESVRIQVDPEWLALTERYYAKVPLPLPRDAAAQNLVLAILTSQTSSDDYNLHLTLPRPMLTLCRKLGIDHGTRNRVLMNALTGAQKWFERNGGELGWEIKGRKIVFYLHTPKIGPKRMPSVSSRWKT